MIASVTSPSSATPPNSGDARPPKRAAASGQRPSPQPRYSPPPEPGRVALQPTLEAPPMPSATSRSVARLALANAAGSPARFIPPSRINEFTIFEPLGHGAMGQVFRAHDSLLDRAVAIKLLASENPTTQARERFLIEARAIARLQHPNVVAIHRVGLHGKRPYIVSELVPGQSLDRTPLPLPATRARSLGLGIARGLAAAHRQGVLHRDIKPGNVATDRD